MFKQATPKKVMYLTSLLNETVPGSLFDEALLTELDLPADHCYGLIHMVFNHQLQNMIELRAAEASDQAADWKTVIQNSFLEYLASDSLLIHGYLNLMPYTRSILISFEETYFDEIKQHVFHWAGHCTDYLKGMDGAGMIAFADLGPAALTDIGRLYKHVRRLQNYKFVLGMGTITFYDGFPYEKDADLEVTPLMQRYEHQLKEAISLVVAVLEDLKAHIKAKGYKDPQITYIYKELMSLTNRWLFMTEGDHGRVIDALNQSINDFAGRFNDLEDLHLFMLDIITELNRSDDRPLHPHIKRCLKIIHRDFQKGLTLDAAADELHLSGPHLSRLFRQEMGMTFKQYLTYRRISKIKDLLTTTDWSVEKIAETTGYESGNQLTRIFKKYEGITPRNYRRS